MLSISFKEEMQRFNALIYRSSYSDIEKRHVILVKVWWIATRWNVMETKYKVYYMMENLSLSIDVLFFFFMEFSNFPPSLALLALHCGIMVKLRDNAKSSLAQAWIYVAPKAF